MSRLLTLYMGVTTQTIQMKADKYLMRILLITGKKALTRKWLQPDAAQLEEWLKAIYEICVMERLIFSLKVQKDKFNEMWPKWRPDLI
ncbi:hypothetical protein LDENG_00067290 [Lucifuga dentata]|nr:hypothetical protein LDENG_00067290 [Lucifuga dentata]